MNTEPRYISFIAKLNRENSTLQSVTVGNDDKITGIKIKHGETVVIRNLPENTTAVVTEELSTEQRKITLLRIQAIIRPARLLMLTVALSLVQFPLIKQGNMSTLLRSLRVAKRV